MRKFLAISGEKRALVLEAFRLMTVLTIGFRLAGARRMQSAVEVPLGSAPAGGSDPSHQIRMARHSLLMVQRATGISGTCLSRSLALRAMLRKRGIDTTMKVGYRKKDGLIEGHAWLEYQGQTINDDPAEICTYTLANGSGKIWWN